MVFEFQFVNLGVLLAESALHFLPNIWCMFAIVFFEGLMGGAAFVNTFFAISQEVSSHINVISQNHITKFDTTLKHVQNVIS